jgi:aspartyl protease family protein
MVLFRYPLRQGTIAALACTLLAMTAPPALGVIQQANAASDASGRTAPQTIARADDGLFYLPASVSGTSLRLLVDSGANKVVLTERDARAIGVDIDTLQYSGRMATAAGTIRTASTLLDGLQIDGRTFNHVAVVVTDRSDGVSLLGQDLLARLGTVVMNRDGMQIHHRS